MSIDSMEDLTEEEREFIRKRAQELTSGIPFVNEVRVVDPTTGGMKGQKLARFDLLPWDVIWTLAELYGAGASKYEDRNWERSYPFSLSIAALGRHFALFVQGEDDDPETGLPHLAAVMFHAAALMRFCREHPEQDDRAKSR